MTEEVCMGMIVVEGKDDTHVIRHLLHRHGMHVGKDDSGIKIKSLGGDLATHRDGEDDESERSKRVVAMTLEIKAHGSYPIGLVFDIDVDLPRRWQAVRDRLANIGLEMPSTNRDVLDALPDSGLIVRSEKYKRWIGLWFMPDNRQRGGTLEDLLIGLVPKDDALFELSSEATDKAIEISRSRPLKASAIGEGDRRKGTLHCWLAWQDKPGCPYGTAINNQYFRHDSEAALSFVAWCRELFSAPSA